jgi:hypothetical protein
VPSSLIQAKTHTAVHINWNKWMVISVWHSMFSSLYGHVSYHVELGVTQRPESPLDHLTHFHHYYHAARSGGLSYNTLLYVLAGSVREARSADVIVWQHDDSFLDARWVAGWAADARRARNKSACVAIADYVPLTSTMLNRSTERWARMDDLKYGARAMMLKDQARLNYTFCSPTTTEPLASLFSYAKGTTDAILLAPRCANFSRFEATLSAFSRAQLFLELAVPTAVECGLAPEDRTEFPIFTLLKADRQNKASYLRNLTSSATPPKQQKPTIGQYHPVKTLPLEGLFAQLDMRDFVFKHTS